MEKFECDHRGIEKDDRGWEYFICAKHNISILRRELLPIHRGFEMVNILCSEIESDFMLTYQEVLCYIHQGAWVRLSWHGDGNSAMGIYGYSTVFMDNGALVISNPGAKPIPIKNSIDNYRFHILWPACEKSHVHYLRYNLHYSYCEKHGTSVERKSPPRERYIDDIERRLNDKCISEITKKIIQARNNNEPN